ncbi:MAG: HDOD domain-containing protein [Burkholderiaceae bacterium]
MAAELSSQDLAFPTSINAAVNIRRVLNDPDFDNEQIARIISNEPVLLAHVLWICDSVMFARPTGQIRQLRAATSRLGFVGIRNAAISLGMKQLSKHGSTRSRKPEVGGRY